MSTQIIKFCSEDDIILDGFIKKSNKKTDKLLISIHGMASNCFNNRDMVISNKLLKMNIDTICFNNRGSDIIRYCKKNNGRSVLGGTAFEDVEEGYYDILGVIKYAINNGYTNIYLQGHSLGATKIVYTYNKMKKENNKYIKYIKGIISLSLVDIPDIIMTNVPKNIFDLANIKEKEDKLTEILPIEKFFHPLSVGTLLKYIKHNENINFARYSENDYDFSELKNIDVPLFMRWGNNNELIKQNAKDLVEFIKRKINKKNIDINYYEDANHSYNGKEEILANDICSFLI